MPRPLLALVLALAAAPAAHAQSYELSWWTVDGGGTTANTGGTYTLGATAGQPDAGGPYAASPYVLHSGFWALAAGGAVGPQADLSITKTDGQATATPGTIVTYTIVTANAGPSPVSAAPVTDAPPAALTGVSWTCAASSGATCPPSGSGGIAAAVGLPPGGTATFTLTGTVAPGATGTLANTASIAVPSGVLESDPSDNQATDTDTLTPSADLSIAVADSPDPVAAGTSLTYTVTVTNIGPSMSPSATVTDVLPAGVSFASSNPACAHVAGTVTCTVGALAPAAIASITITATVNPSTTGSVTDVASVAGAAVDPSAANNTDSETTTVILRAKGELSHGILLRADLAGVGAAADVDLYRIRQQPYSSYEVLVDETSGDIGAGAGPLVDRVGPDGSTVLQSSVAAGAGPSRSLRFSNADSSAIDTHMIRVRSASCASDCGPDDTYRLRAWETTASVARFNNSGNQVTVLLLQNTANGTVTGTVYAWGATGTLAGQQPFTLAPRALLVLNTGAIAPGGAGSLTIAHDGPYGVLAGKTVALEPSSGFSFDAPLEARPR